MGSRQIYQLDPVTTVNANDKFVVDMYSSSDDQYHTKSVSFSAMSEQITSPISQRLTSIESQVAEGGGAGGLRNSFFNLYYPGAINYGKLNAGTIVIVPFDGLIHLDTHDIEWNDVNIKTVTGITTQARFPFTHDASSVEFFVQAGDELTITTAQTVCLIPARMGETASDIFDNIDIPLIDIMSAQGTFYYAPHDIITGGDTYTAKTDTMAGTYFGPPTLAYTQASKIWSISKYVAYTVGNTKTLNYPISYNGAQIGFCYLTRSNNNNLYLKCTFNATAITKYLIQYKSIDNNFYLGNKETTLGPPAFVNMNTFFQHTTKEQTIQIASKNAATILQIPDVKEGDTWVKQNPKLHFRILDMTKK